jgi:hypothetical protein
MSLPLAFPPPMILSPRKAPMIEPNAIFVFGSNLAGKHGAGAAWQAFRHYGAIRGQGEGLQGRSYAIPTKDEQLVKIPLPGIAIHVRRFLGFARIHTDLEFWCTPIGCGLANYKPKDIAPMFRGAPPNVHLPDSFAIVLDGIG